MLSEMAGQVIRGQDEDRLPARVRQAIHAQQDQSEILVGWFLLVVVSAFGVLYLITPKTFTEDAPFAPVPWALSIYLVLTIFRLIWAYNGRIPDWALTASVVFDVLLLMVLIWSFHIQYDQPASFYLKAPTLMYVFIFIALRALRFEARFVLLTGVVAALGWGAMILYVISIDPVDTMITRNYVEYLTSNSVLLGAEFDKMLSILMVTAIIAVALSRAKALLVSAVTEQTAAQELSRFFDPEIAQKIKSSDQGILAGTGELREAAVVNLDMRGFTRLAHERSPDQVMGLLAEYQSRLVPVIQKHGGSIDKFMGDGIMATFGAAVPTESYAADALRSIDAVIAEAAAWRAERAAAGKPAPEVNASVATGRILFGAVGDETRLEYTVIGDAVNLSAKLEKENKAQRVRALCDGATYDLALAQGYQPPAEKERRASRDVGGVSDALDLVVLAA